MPLKVKSMLILLTTAAIWGIAYVAQKLSLNTVGPFTLNSMRGGLAALTLVPCSVILSRANKKDGERDTKDGRKKKRLHSVLAGMLTGTWICIASVLQAYGIQSSEVGKAGFLTALYIVIVPVLSLFAGEKNNILIWLGVALAVLGSYLLCGMKGFSIAPEDAKLLLCAFFYALNIFTISRVAGNVDAVMMSMMQFFFSAVLTFIPAIIIEHPTGQQVLRALPFVLYSGVFSCGVGYTIEIIGQRGLPPVVASLILSFESVFSALAGWALLGEVMPARSIAGCLLIIAAVVVAQLRDVLPKVSFRKAEQNNG